MSKEWKITRYTCWEEKWLNQHGGRDTEDLCHDEEGLYVWMWKGDGKIVQVYLPTVDNTVYKSKKVVEKPSKNVDRKGIISGLKRRKKKLSHSYPQKK